MVTIYKTMAGNSRRKSSRRRVVNDVKEVEASNLNIKIEEMAKEIKDLKMEEGNLKTQLLLNQMEVCTLCGYQGHGPATCPMPQMQAPLMIDGQPMVGEQGNMACVPYQQQQQGEMVIPEVQASVVQPYNQQGGYYNNQQGGNQRPNYPYQPRQQPQQWQPRQNFQQGQSSSTPYRAPYQAPNQQYRAPYQAPTQQQQPLRPPQQPSSNNFEEWMKKYAEKNDLRMDSLEVKVGGYDAVLNSINTQMGQMATTLGKMQAKEESGRLPSQPSHAKALTVLRSGKIIDNKVRMPGEEVEKGKDAAVFDEENEEDIEEIVCERKGEEKHIFRLGICGRGQRSQIRSRQLRRSTTSSRAILITVIVVNISSSKNFYLIILYVLISFARLMNAF